MSFMSSGCSASSLGGGSAGGVNVVVRGARGFDRFDGFDGFRPASA